jgi:putative membrane protein
MRAILSKVEQDYLAQKIADAERNTAGELVAVVLHKSASYGAYRVAFAGLFALLFVSTAHVLWPWVTAMELLGAEAVVAIALFWFLGLPSLLRLVTPRAVQRRAVSDRVKQLFIERGVTETRDRSGVLILLSALERRVEILGDRGIHEHLGNEAWQAMVNELAESLRGGKAAEGLARVIDRIGRELAAHFPPRPDDTNELPNRVVTDDG